MQLEPCPWCGEALASVSVSEGSTFRWRKVDGCCADGPEVRHDTMADDQVAAEVESRAKAITAWNTRANVLHHTAPLRYALDNAVRDIKTLREVRDAHAAEIEALREERDLICAEALKYADKSGRLEAKVDQLVDELRKIAELRERHHDNLHDAVTIAEEALRDSEQEVGNWTCEMRPNT